MAEETSDEFQEVDTVDEPIPLSQLRQDGNAEENVQEVEIDIKKKQTDNKATLNIKDKKFISEFVQEPTKEADQYQNSGSSEEPAAQEPVESGETVADIRKRLEQEEKEEVEKLTPEDFADMADFIIDLVDMGLLFGIRWYSMDVSDAEYKVPEEKLKKLKKHLSRILMRVGKKFPVGWLLVFGILAAYATPVRKAHENRKRVMQEKARKELKRQKRLEDEDDEPSYVPLKKRKRGGQPK